MKEENANVKNCGFHLEGKEAINTVLKNKKVKKTTFINFNEYHVK